MSVKKNVNKCLGLVEMTKKIYIDIPNGRSGRFKYFQVPVYCKSITTSDEAIFYAHHPTPYVKDLVDVTTTALERRIWMILFIAVRPTLTSPEDMDVLPSTEAPGYDSDLCHPLVIGHRGACGYVPEHTLASYSLAVFMGADYIEPDLVMTKDGHFVVRHDNQLGRTTNVAAHPEFASRYRRQTIDGQEFSDWFIEDFTLAELKTLRAIERIPDIRPSNARLDGAFEIPTFQETIDLAKSLEKSQNRVVGIYPEIKHSTHFKQLGLPLEQKLVDILHSNGYRGSVAPVYIQSFEINNLKELKQMTDLRLLQLFDSKTKSPYDQVVQGSTITYGCMATPAGLKEISEYAYAVAPEKSYIIPRDESNRLGTVTPFVDDAHTVGLKVHPYTFRAENYYLPREYQSDYHRFSTGNLTSEIEAYFAAGIDGLIVDQPNIAIRTRSTYYSTRKLNKML